MTAPTYTAQVEAVRVDGDVRYETVVIYDDPGNITAPITGTGIHWSFDQALAWFRGQGYRALTLWQIGPRHGTFETGFVATAPVTPTR